MQLLRNFHLCMSNADGRHSYCKACHREVDKLRHKAQAQQNKKRKR